jgi:HlyD family secretion protein
LNRLYATAIAMAFMAGAIVAALIGRYVSPLGKAPQPAVVVKPAEPTVRRADLSVIRAERGVYREESPFNAKVVSTDAVFLDAAEGGRVARLLAEPGDVVTQGQPLIEFDNATLELDVLDRESRLIASISQLQTYETTLEQTRINSEKQLAQIDYDIIRLGRSITRRNALAAKGAEAAELKDVVQDELDYDRRLRPMQAESNKRQNDLRHRQMPEIKSQLDMLEQDLKITRGKLENLTVRAPVAGRITDMQLTVGQNRNRGDRLAEITPDTGYRLTAEIEESHLGQVHIGQEAKIRLDGKDWPLHLARLYPKVAAGRFTVELTFDGTPPAGLLPGQGVSGTLFLGGSPDTLMLAEDGHLPPGHDAQVFVLASDGHSAHRQTIKIGRRNPAQIEVLGGLTPGDQVVVAGFANAQSAPQFLVTE